MGDVTIDEVALLALRLKANRTDDAENIMRAVRPILNEEYISDEDRYRALDSFRHYARNLVG